MTGAERAARARRAKGALRRRMKKKGAHHAHAGPRASTRIPGAPLAKAKVRGREESSIRPRLPHPAHHSVDRWDFQVNMGSLRTRLLPQRTTRRRARAVLSTIEK